MEYSYYIDEFGLVLPVLITLAAYHFCANEMSCPA